MKSFSPEFLPANATLVVHPMDQGVIQNIKVLYHSKLLHRMLLCTDIGKSYSTDLLSAIPILGHAWEQTQATRLKRCFHNAGRFEAHEYFLKRKALPMLKLIPYSVRQ